MSQCATIKTNRVICEQSFTVKDIETNIPIRIPLSPTDRIDTEATKVNVTVTECDLRIDGENDLFLIDFKLFVEKQIVIAQNGGSTPGAELGFNLLFPGLQFINCRPSEIPMKDQAWLFCEVFRVEVEGDVILDKIANTFSENIVVNIIVKIVVEDELTVQLCQGTPPPPVSPIVLQALAILAGKIRAIIGNQTLKQQLLQQIDQVNRLLKMGMVEEALLILNVMANELQQVINTSPFFRVPVNLVLTDLIIVEKEIKKLF